MTRDEIQIFIDDDINPALESHGGHLLIHDYNEEKKLLRLRMTGGCQGCASSMDNFKTLCRKYSQRRISRFSRSRRCN